MQTFTGKQYLMIDIANNFGLDKENWDVRLKWFEDNQHQLAQLVQQADEPALFFAGYRAYDNMIQGKPSGYPISLDATSSGLQILACLTGDRKAALMCNVVDNGKREDAYTVVFNQMVHHLVNELGLQAGGIKRDDCKQAIMTSLYSSVAVPKQVFGEGVQLTVFYETMADMAPAVWELNTAFLNMWRPDVLEHTWVLPDNFHVKVKVMDSIKETVHFQNRPYETYYKVNQPMEQGRSIGANVVHSLDGMIVREMTRRCMYKPEQIEYLVGILNTDSSFHGTSDVTEDDKMVQILWKHYEESDYLSARILDHLNLENLGHVNENEIWELIWSLPEKPFDLVAVHDCFRCLPNYGNDLRKQYNIQMSELANSKMLQYLIRQITGNHQLNIGKLDDTLWEDALVSNYSLS